MFVLVGVDCSGFSARLSLSPPEPLPACGLDRFGALISLVCTLHCVARCTEAHLPDQEQNCVCEGLNCFSRNRALDAAATMVTLFVAWIELCRRHCMRF